MPERGGTWGDRIQSPGDGDPRPLYSLDHARRGRDGNIGGVTWHIASHAGKRRSADGGGYNMGFPSIPGMWCARGRASGGSWYLFPISMRSCSVPRSVDRGPSAMAGIVARLLRSHSLYYPFYPSAAIAAHVEGFAAGRDRRPGRHFLFACMPQSFRSLLAASACIYPCYWGGRGQTHRSRAPTMLIKVPFPANPPQKHTENHGVRPQSRSVWRRHRLSAERITGTHK